LSGATGQSPAPQSDIVPKRGPSLLMRIVITAVGLAVWFVAQALIGSRGMRGAGIGDGLLEWTAPANHYLVTHPRAANALLIASSAIIDSLGILLLCKWIFGSKLRPFAGLVITLLLREIVQGLVALPTPEGAIWHYPGFPSLLVTYGVANDYFFSGQTAIAVLGAAELIRARKPWLTGLALLMVVFEVSTVLCLRAHYTMDVFTGAVTALYAGHLANRFFPDR
jgi:hypothetical protein